MGTELVVLMDESGAEIGSAEKTSVHHGTTPLHKAFSCYIFNGKGEFLVTQRALSKKVWPGVWTNSVCGHPAPGESYEDAIERRLSYELGMKAMKPICIAPNYRYTSPPYEGIIENEICPVFAVRTGDEPYPNPDEVEAYQWVNWESYILDTQKNPDKYSYWCRDQLGHIMPSIELFAVPECKIQ